MLRAQCLCKAKFKSFTIFMYVRVIFFTRYSLLEMNINAFGNDDGKSFNGCGTNKQEEKVKPSICIDYYLNRINCDFDIHTIMYMNAEWVTYRNVNVKTEVVSRILCIYTVKVETGRENEREREWVGLNLICHSHPGWWCSFEIGNINIYVCTNGFGRLIVSEDHWLPFKSFHTYAHRKWSICMCVYVKFHEAYRIMHCYTVQ